LAEELYAAAQYATVSDLDEDTQAGQHLHCPVIKKKGEFYFLRKF
jgi:hypothetical protein